MPTPTAAATLPEPHATLVGHASRMTPAQFVATHAQHFAFRDICLAVAAAYSADYDTAVGAVRRVWPETIRISA